MVSACVGAQESLAVLLEQTSADKDAIEMRQRAQAGGGESETPAAVHDEEAQRRRELLRVKSVREQVVASVVCLLVSRGCAWTDECLCSVVYSLVCWHCPPCARQENISC